MILSPVDFRRASLDREELRGLPPWTAGLYTRLRDELQGLPSQ